MINPDKFYTKEFTFSKEVGTLQYFNYHVYQSDLIDEAYHSAYCIHDIKLYHDI